MADPQIKPIAVAFREFVEFGCPYCGCSLVFPVFAGEGTTVGLCGECHCIFAMLHQGTTRSGIGFLGYYPQLVDHPRRHKQPPQGGEYFDSRGIGRDTTPGCFVCGGNNGMYHNIAAFVHSKAAGERVVAMFKHGARFNYRDFEPGDVQVKVGGCDDHLDNLVRLHTRTRDNNGVITTDIVQEAMHL